MHVEKRSSLLGGIQLFLPTYDSLPLASDKKRIDCKNSVFIKVMQNTTNRRTGALIAVKI